MLVGYARISTVDQNLDLQIDALKKEGCEKIFKDVGSGSKFSRSGLDEAIQFMREGDILVVWRLDRLGRSLKNLIEVVTDFQEKKIGFRSLQENIDTSTSSGKLIFHIFASLAEFEREIIRERTKAGLEAARSRGKKGGRKKIMDSTQIAMAKSLRNDSRYTIDKICETLKVSRSTFYRYLSFGERQ